MCTPRCELLESALACVLQDVNFLRPHFNVCPKMWTSQEHVRMHSKMWTSQEQVQEHGEREACEVDMLANEHSS